VLLCCCVVVLLCCCVVVLLCCCVVVLITIIYQIKFLSTFCRVGNIIYRECNFAMKR